MTLLKIADTFQGYSAPGGNEGISRMRSFKKEIVGVLLFKVTLMYVIWFLFFSSPVSDSLTADNVSAMQLGTNETYVYDKEDPL